MPEKISLFQVSLGKNGLVGRTPPPPPPHVTSIFLSRFLLDFFLLPNYTDWSMVVGGTAVKFCLKELY